MAVSFPLLVLACFCLAAGAPPSNPDLLRSSPSREQKATFRNPISDERIADPWVLLWNSSYYLIKSNADKGLRIYKSNNLGDFRNAEKVTIWTAPSTGMWSNGVWAPELHRINGQFYAYVAADNGNNINHRMYVLRADDSNNPMGTYTFIGKIADARKDWWAIDGTVMQHRNGKNYFIYSGWDKAYNYDPMVQHLFIAEMASPTSIVPGTATLIKSPVFRWETDGQAVVEGPAVVEHNGSYFLLYSAGASWTEFYSTGVMTLDGNANPLNPASWKTTDHPIFPRNEADGVFGPGHASFTTSPDGKENWIVYHALDKRDGGWSNRSPRAQKYFFDDTGFPIFPPAVGFHHELPLPSGTRL